MKTFSVMILALLLAGLSLVGSGCFLEDKVIELVVTGETCADFQEDEDSASWNTPRTLDYAEQIQSILDDNGLHRSDIEEAKVTSATYTITQYSDVDEWTISGAITVKREYTGEPAVIVTYTDQDVNTGVVDIQYVADLESDGVDILNQALTDFINGVNPIITFEVVNDTVVPAPTPENRLVFNWEACIKLHIVVSEEVELPDWP
jgi:hypothetical protein